MSMPMSESLIVERPSDDIVVLRLNRPQVRNALNLEVRAGLAEKVTQYGAEKAVRCLIVAGSDVVFAAGADIGEMAEADPVEVMSRNVQKYWRAIMDCPKPLIAAVEGYALGGGLELALCADIIIAGEGAKLGLPEVQVGILRGAGGPQKPAPSCRPSARDAFDHDGKSVRSRRSVRHGCGQRGRTDRAGIATRTRCCA